MVVVLETVQLIVGVATGTIYLTGHHTSCSQWHQSLSPFRPQQQLHKANHNVALGQMADNVRNELGDIIRQQDHPCIDPRGDLVGAEIIADKAGVSLEEAPELIVALFGNFVAANTGCAHEQCRQCCSGCHHC